MLNRSVKTPKRILALLILLWSHCGVVVAQEGNVARTLAPVEIKSKTNRGDLPYRPFHRIFRRLLTLLPASPRIIEPMYQMSFAELGPKEQDAFLKPTWNVAVVGDSVDVNIPVIRGGYFLLPSEEIPAAADASIMFNSQTRRNFLGVAWKIKLTDQQALGYHDFAKSLQEVAYVQERIPWYSMELWTEKRAKFDGLKACFASDEGEVRVSGEPVSVLKSAKCQIYKFDPALAASDAEIAFVGPLEIVVLENSERYQPAVNKTSN